MERRPEIAGRVQMERRPEIAGRVQMERSRAEVV